jgi:KipI family sensor histidine kinase inhibitor
VVEAHTEQVWTVGFVGFAPGFGYLVGEDARLKVPRRDAPRSAVPVGAVGLADEYSGVYPRRSPGGWQLIGRTEVAMWDVARDPPALLRPGGTVRFVEAS